MKQNLLTILLIFSISNTSVADEAFRYLGTYDYIRSTDTGHCYGNRISIWNLKDNKVIGLLNVYSGPCADPPCSILEGTLRYNKISFKTSVPIYNEIYSFIGDITNSELTGSLNGENTTLNTISFKLTPEENIKEWCTRWSQVTRCGGVREFCQ